MRASAGQPENSHRGNVVVLAVGNKAYRPCYRACFVKSLGILNPEIFIGSYHGVGLCGFSARFYR